MKKFQTFAPILMALLGITAFSKNDEGVNALTEEQKQTLITEGYESDFLEGFNAALAVDFAETEDVTAGGQQQAQSPDLSTLKQVSLDLIAAQKRVAQMEKDNNATKEQLQQAQADVQRLNGEVEKLSNKAEDDAGDGAQAVNHNQNQNVVMNLNDNKQLGGLQGVMWGLENRPYNKRARASLLLKQGIEIGSPVQADTDYSQLVADLGEFYRTRRSDNIESFVRELPSVTNIFPLESNVKDREVITNLFLGEFSQADNSGSSFENVVKGTYEIQPEEIRMYDVMFAHKFKDLKKLEKSWIGYLSQNSSSFKMSFVEYLLRETVKVLNNEQQLRRIQGIRKEPELNVPGTALSASTGLYRYIHEKINNYQIKTTVLGEITQANIGEKVFEMIKSIPQNLIDSNMLVLYMPAAMKMEYNKYNETHYGTNQDYKADLMYVKEFPSVKIIEVPNAGSHRRLIVTFEGNLKCFENVPGEMLNFTFIPEMWGINVSSQWKEGFAAPLVGKKFDRAVDQDYDHQFIFASDVDLPATEYVAMGKDDTTPSVLFNTSLVSVANSELKTITTIKDAVVGQLINLKNGSDTYGIKIVKSGDFSLISADWTPAVGDTITLFKRADGKFIEYARATAAASTVAFGVNDTSPSVAGATLFQIGANTQATAITSLENAVVGTIYTIYGNGSTYASTIANSGNFTLTAAMTLSTGTYIKLMALAEGKFAEVERG